MNNTKKKSESNYFTIGQLARQGLLLNPSGEPITNTGTLSRIVDKIGATEMQTPWGKAKCITPRQVVEYNLAQAKMLKP